MSENVRDLETQIDSFELEPRQNETAHTLRMVRMEEMTQEDLNKLLEEKTAMVDELSRLRRRENHWNGLPEGKDARAKECDCYAELEYRDELMSVTSTLHKCQKDLHAAETKQVFQRVVIENLREDLASARGENRRLRDEDALLRRIRSQEREIASSRGQVSELQVQVSELVRTLCCSTGRNDTDVRAELRRFSRPRAQQRGGYDPNQGDGRGEGEGGSNEEGDGDGTAPPLD